MNTNLQGIFKHDIFRRIFFCKAEKKYQTSKISIDYFFVDFYDHDFLHSLLFYKILT